MSKVLKFENFIKESEASEHGAFIVTDETISYLEKRSKNFWKLRESGVISAAEVIQALSWKTKEKTTFSLNGIRLTVEVDKMADLINKLSEQRYNISPDWFNSEGDAAKKRIEIVFNQNKDLKIEEYELDTLWSFKRESYLGKRSARTISQSALSGAYRTRPSERIKDLVVEYNCETEEQFLEIFESGMDAIIKELCDVKVIYLTKSKTEDNIPPDLNLEIKLKIKDIYQKAIIQFFETGIAEDEITTLSEVILDIYEETPELITTFKEVPEDVSSEVIEKAESGSYPSTLVKDLKKMRKLKDILKYN